MRSIFNPLLFLGVGIAFASVGYGQAQTVNVSQLCIDLGIRCEVLGAESAELIDALSRTPETSALPDTILRHIHSCPTLRTRGRDCAEFSPIRPQIDVLHFIPASGLRAARLEGGVRFVFDCHRQMHLYVDASVGANSDHRVREFRQLLSRLMSPSWAQALATRREHGFRGAHSMTAAMSLDLRGSNLPTRLPGWVASGGGNMAAPQTSTYNVSADFGPLPRVHPDYLVASCWGLDTAQVAPVAAAQTPRTAFAQFQADFAQVMRLGDYVTQVCGDEIEINEASLQSHERRQDQRPSIRCQSVNAEYYRLTGRLMPSFPALSREQRILFMRARIGQMSTPALQRGAQIMAIATEQSTDPTDSTALPSTPIHLDPEDVSVVRQVYLETHNAPHGNEFEYAVRQLLRNPGIRGDVFPEGAPEDFNPPPIGIVTPGRP